MSRNILTVWERPEMWDFSSWADSSFSTPISRHLMSSFSWSDFDNWQPTAFDVPDTHLRDDFFQDIQPLKDSENAKPGSAGSVSRYSYYSSSADSSDGKPLRQEYKTYIDSTGRRKERLTRAIGDKELTEIADITGDSEPKVEKKTKMGEEELQEFERTWANTPFGAAAKRAQLALDQGDQK